MNHISPYLKLMRLDKPQGAVLVFWPFAWGLTMAAYREKLSIDLYSKLLIQFFFGAFLLRGTAVTFNDICDRNLDRGVERTKSRPLAARLISTQTASVFLVAEILLCVAFFWSLNRAAFWATMFGLIPMAGAYPLMKRVTYWPQAWLGISANFGLVIAWLAVYQHLEYRLILALMAGLWCWTMFYDTIYACQDKKDDVKVGIKSTALLFGRMIRPILNVCATIFAAMMLCTGILNHQGFVYYMMSVVGVAVHLIWQLSTVDLENPKSCWQNFRKNSHLGWIVWGGLFLDYVRVISVHS